MTTQFAVLKNLPAGLTFTSAKLFAVSAPDTVLTGNTFSFSNRANATSQYVVSIDRSPTALPAGDYTLIAYIGTAPRAELNCTFAGTDGETASETPEVAELNTDTQGQIDALTRGLIAGVVGSSSSTTVVNVTSTESGLAVTDQLKGRVIIFNKDTTTAALRGQGAPIDTNDTTSITVASGDAFTTAPASGDTFTIY